MALTANRERDAASLVDADSFEILHQLDFELSAAGPAFSGDGQMVVGVSNRETVLVYRVAGGELLGEYSNPNGVYKYAVFVPGSRTIFAGGNDGGYLLDAATGEALRQFSTPGASLYGANSAFVSVSPDGRYGAIHMWTPTGYNVVYLWDLQSGALKFRSSPKRDDVITAFAFSDDSHYVAWGGSSNIAYVRDLDDGAEVRRLPHLSPVLGIDFSSNNRFVLTSSLEDSVKVWDLETGEIVRQYYAGAGPAAFVEFVDDDDFILYTTQEDGIIHRQPLTIDDLIETVCNTLQRDLTLEQRTVYGLDDTSTCPGAFGS